MENRRYGSAIVVNAEHDGPERDNQANHALSSGACSTASPASWAASQACPGAVPSGGVTASRSRTESPTTSMSASGRAGEGCTHQVLCLTVGCHMGRARLTASQISTPRRISSARSSDRTAPQIPPRHRGTKGCCSPRLRRPGPLDPGPARHRLGEGARTPRGRPSPQPPVGGGRSRPAVAPGPPAQADGSATKSRPSPGSRSRFTFPGLGRAIIFFRITVRSPNWRRQGHQQLRPISTTPES